MFPRFCASFNFHYPKNNLISINNSLLKIKIPLNSFKKFLLIVHIFSWTNKNKFGSYRNFFKKKLKEISCFQNIITVNLELFECRKYFLSDVNKRMLFIECYCFWKMCHYAKEKNERIRCACPSAK